MNTLQELVASAFTLIRHRQGDVAAAEIADIFGVSERRARFYLNEATGKNLRTLCLEARLAAARERVRRTLQPIDAVAHDFGYSSRRKFDESYAKVFGASPAADRSLASASSTPPSCFYINYRNGHSGGRQGWGGRLRCGPDNKKQRKPKKWSAFMKHIAAALLLVAFISLEMKAQTTIYWKRDTIYAGPGGGAIATVTPPPSDTTAPTAPSGLGVTSTTATSVALSWTGSTDSGGSSLAGYKIYRQKGSGASLPVGTANSSTTAFTDQPLEPSTSYTYTIVAFDNAQNHSSPSGSVNPTTSTSSGDSTAPSAPPNLRGIATTRASTYKVRLDWDAATDIGGSGIAGYKVYRDNTLISGSTPITNRYYEDSTNSANTSFTYKVTAIDGTSNASGYSSTVTVTTLRTLSRSSRL